MIISKLDAHPDSRPHCRIGLPTLCPTATGPSTVSTCADWPVTPPFCSPTQDRQGPGLLQMKLIEKQWRPCRQGQSFNAHTSATHHFGRSMKIYHRLMESVMSNGWWFEPDLQSKEEWILLTSRQSFQAFANANFGSTWIDCRWIIVGLAV
eukprot:s649_g15.t1